VVVVVRHPPDKSGTPALQPGPREPSAVPQKVTASITDLAGWRTRRLLVPWPGWWGDHERHSWSWAERSRRPA
jgi:hypothetical protein